MYARTDVQTRGEAGGREAGSTGVLPFFHSSRHMKGRTKGLQLKYLSHGNWGFRLFGCCLLSTALSLQNKIADTSIRLRSSIAGERTFPKRVYVIPILQVHKLLVQYDRYSVQRVLS